MRAEKLVAQWISEITYDTLPYPVKARAKQCFLDALGSAIPGTLANVSRLVSDYVAEAWKGDEATVWLRGLRASVAGAALANGYASNALDVDDGDYAAKGHPGAIILPALLVLAEKVRPSGREMLTALVVGYEVGHRVALCWHRFHEPIYHSTGSWGSVAAAAAAAKLIGLQGDALCHALGIAGHHAPDVPMMRVVEFDPSAMVKDGIGWGAFVGVVSAELAAAGFTGAPSILAEEGYSQIVSDIGCEYAMLDALSFKRHCCCGWAQPAVEACLWLMAEDHIEPLDVSRIRVEAFHRAVLMDHRRPQTTDEAQYSVPWAVAAAILDRQVGPGQMLDHRLRDERMLELAEKVELVETDEMNERYQNGHDDPVHGGIFSRVRLFLEDGRELEAESPYIGIPTEGIDQALKDKFRWLVGYTLGEERADVLMDIALHLDALEDPGQLMRLLTRV